MRIRAMLAVVVGLAAAACGPSSGRPQSPYAACAMPEGGTYGGRWATNLGDMELMQDGATVIGSWKDLPNHKTGRIEGTAEGCLLFFTWTQEDETIPGMPRQSAGRGVLQYVVDPPVGTGLPIHRFEGVWGYDNQIEGGGVWTGRKRREGAG